MTNKRDLERLVRERQQRTGESYTTARRQLIAHAKPTDGSMMALPVDAAGGAVMLILWLP